MDVNRAMIREAIRLPSIFFSDDQGLEEQYIRFEIAHNLLYQKSYNLTKL